MNEGYKEVYFHEYCKSCVNHDCSNVDEPCNECLDNPINLYSHKPVKYEGDHKSKEVAKPEVDPLIGVELLNDTRYRSEWIYDKTVDINDAASKYFGLGWYEYKLPAGRYMMSCTNNFARSHPGWDMAPALIYLSLATHPYKWKDGFIITGSYVDSKTAPTSMPFTIKDNEPIYLVANCSGFYDFLTTEVLENLSLKKIG